MADKITNDITLLFKTKLDEKSKQEVGKNLKGLLENAVIGFDETETKRNLEPIVRMMQRLFDKAEMSFDADKLLSMPSRQALEEMAKMEVNQLQLAFDKALAKSGGVKIDFGDIGLSELAAPLKQIEDELSGISKRVADTTKKSVYEIEKSLKSLSKNKEFKKIASPESIENTLLESSNDKKLHPSRAVSQLEKARDLYDKSVKEDNPWVVQYKYLLDFVSKYEKLTHQAKQKIESERPEFTQLYDMLSPKAGAVKISLEHYVDMAKGNELSEYKNQPWGRESTLKEIRDTLKNGISVKEGSGGGDNGHKNDATPPWEDNNKDTNSNKLNTKVSLDVSKSDVEKAASDAATQEQQILNQKIEETQNKIKENKKKIAEIKKDISSNKSFKMYKGIGAEDAVDFDDRDDVYSTYQADYYSSDIKAAASYAADEESHVVVAEIAPKDALMFDAKKYSKSGDYSEVLSSPAFIDDLKTKLKNRYAQSGMSEQKLQKKYAEIDKLEFIVGDLLDAEGNQMLVNEAAYDAGFDSVIFDNVLDFATNMVEGKAEGEGLSAKRQTGKTIAVLKDEILKIIGFHKVEETKNGQSVSEELLKEIPDYYHMPYQENEDGDLEPQSVADFSDNLKKNAELEAEIDAINKQNKKLQKELQELKGKVSTEVDSKVDNISNENTIEDDKVDEITAKKAETDAINQQNEALKENIELKAKANAQDSSNHILSSLTKLEKITNKSLSEVINDYDNLDNSIKQNVDSILQSIGLMGSDGQFLFDRKQGGNAKAFVTDNFVILQKHITTNNEEISIFIEKLQQAKQEGIQLAEVLGQTFSLNAKENIGFRKGYEIQERGEGDEVHASPKLIELNQALAENQKILNLSDEHLQKFILDYIKLDQIGLQIDPSKPSNFLLDAEKGITFIDIGLKDVNAKAKSTADIFTEIATILSNMVGYMKFGENGDWSKSSGQIVNRIRDIFAQLNLSSSEEMNKIIEEKFARNNDMKSVLLPENTSIPADSSEAKASIDIEELRGLLNSITYNVKVIQDAEPVEGNKVSINADELRSVLDGITYNVKLAQGETDGDSNKIAIDEGILENVLNRVFSSVLKPVDNSVDMGKVFEAIQSIPTGGKSSKDVDINPHYVTDPSGKPVVAYRGIQGNYGGLVSNRYHGGTFSTDDIELAQQYAGEMGKIEKVLLSMKNPLEIDGRGANWDHIEYIGHGADEASRQLLQLNKVIKVVSESIDNYTDGDEIYSPITGETFNDIESLKSHLTELKMMKQEIFDDQTNPYGYGTTNDWSEFAKSKRYDGVIFKNVYDGLDKASNLLVTFQQDQIHYIETISSEAKTALDDLQMSAGEFDKYINMTDDDVAGMVKQLEIMRDHFLDDWSLGKENPEDIYSRVKGEFIDPDPAFKSLFEAYLAPKDLPDGYAMLPDFLSPAGFNGNDLFVDLSNFLTHIRETVQKTQVGSDIAATSTEEPWALESTLQSVKSVLDQIQTNTAKIGQKPQAQVNNSNNTLDSINKNVSEINTKIVRGTKTVIGGSNIKTPTNTKNRVSDNFDERKETQRLRLEKLRAELKTTGKSVAEITKLTRGLAISLGKVKNDKGLARWREKFTQKGLEVGISKIEDKSYNDLIKDYEKLGRLRAKFEGSRTLEDRESLRILAEQVDAKRKSMGLTSQEIQLLRQKSHEAYEESKRLVNAAKQQKVINQSQKDAEKAKKDSDKAKVAQLNKIAKLEKEIGRLRADADAETNEGVRKALEEEIQLRQQLIGLIKQSPAEDSDDSNEYIAYHGTIKGGFKNYDMSKTQAQDALFFTDDRDVAKTYSDGVEKDIDLDSSEIQKGIYTNKLTINNPYIVDAQGKNWDEIGDIKGDTNSAYNIGAKKFGDGSVAYQGKIWDIGGAQHSVYGDEANVHKIIAALYDPDTADVIIARLKKQQEIQSEKFEQGLIIDANDTFRYNREHNQYPNNLSNLVAEMAFAKGHDGVIFKNMVDSGGGNGSHAPSTVYAIRDASQAQIVDPATIQDGKNDALEEEISLRDRILEKQKQGLELDAQEEAYYRQMVANHTKQAKKEDKKRAADAKKLAQREAMLGKTGSAVGRAESTWVNAVGLEGDLPASFTTDIDEYYQKLDALRKKHQELKNSDMISEEQKKELIAQTMEINKMTSEIGELVAEYQRLSGDNASVIGMNTLGSDAGLSAYEQQLKQTVMTATNGKAQIKSFDAATQTLTYTVKTGKNEFTEYTAAVRHLDGQLVAVQGTTKKTETFLEATKRKMKEISSYMSGMALISRAGQELRRGIQYVREIDLALTELRKVTNETKEEYDQFLKTASKTGARLGTTISAVTEATATFAKLGYTMEQATEMAESAIVYKNVGDNIESTGDAADSIISTLKGFELEVTDTMKIVDSFNEVGNRFAITSQGIGEALRLSASALNEGGNSLHESIGLITAANEVVNDPSSVGTALKTLTLRLRGSKTELEEMGEDVSDMATTTSALQAKLLALTGGQVDIMLDENTFKNSTQILREMADAWEDMTDIQRAEWCPYVQKCA